MATKKTYTHKNAHELNVVQSQAKDHRCAEIINAFAHMAEVSGDLPYDHIRKMNTVCTSIALFPYYLQLWGSSILLDADGEQIEHDFWCANLETGEVMVRKEDEDEKGETEFNGVPIPERVMAIGAYSLWFKAPLTLEHTGY